MKIKKELKNILFNIFFAILTLLAVILFYKNILLCFLIIALVSFVGLIKWKSKITLILQLH